MGLVDLTDFTDDEEYNVLSKSLLEELNEISGIDPEFEIHMGDKRLLAKQMADEITNKTEIGVKYMSGYKFGLGFLGQ